MLDQTTHFGYKSFNHYISRYTKVLNGDGWAAVRKRRDFRFGRSLLRDDFDQDGIGAVFVKPEAENDDRK